MEERERWIDQLTGIYNLEGFYKATEELFAKNPDKKYIIAYWDVQRFKVINELFGRKAGDAILKDMADVLGKNFEEMTITKLIGYLDKQPNEQERLSEIRTKILATGKEMQDCNLRNEKLLQQALEMVEFDLTLFKSMRQAPETANYDKNACNTGDLLGNSGFDAKQ